MLDVAKFKRLQPAHAEGRVRIDLTDPVTGKVKYRQAGENYVFPESLICGNYGDWPAAISAIQLELSDSTAAIDTNFPYMIGNTIGYGLPSQSGSGLYRGAYSIANQVLAEQNGTTSLRWKFQYDFTTAQANGTIGRIGLTHQSIKTVLHHPARYPGYSGAAITTQTCDGRYCYSCTTAGVITVTDMYTGTTSTIDVSATVGTVAGTTKSVGYAPATGKYYICALSSTSANRKMYVFSDKTFATLENTYNITNTTTTGSAPVYVYGDYAFHFASSAVTKISFISNAAPTTITPSATPFGTSSYFNECTIPYSSYILSHPASASAYGAIFDMAQQKFCGLTTNPAYRNSSSTKCCMRAPLLSSFVVCLSDTGLLCVSPAIAMKKLDAPVTKTSANGMTVTYELEVFW